MSEGVAFFAEVLMLVSSLGGLFGLTFYLGYRAGQRNPVAQMAEALNQVAANHAVAMKSFLERGAVRSTEDCPIHHLSMVPVKWMPEGDVQQVCLRCWKEKIEAKEEPNAIPEA